MKPCYRRKGKLYLLAHLNREGGQFPQPCKAVISPGKGPALTRVTGEFLRRCGWFPCEAGPSNERSKTASVARARSKAKRKIKAAAHLFRCTLVVGECHISTVLEVVENMDFTHHCVLSKWHIHIGQKDYQALQRNAWDSDVCYLSANPNLERIGSRPICPLQCDTFTGALQNGHPNCMSYRHKVRISNHKLRIDDHPWGHIWSSDEVHSFFAARQQTAEMLMHEHDVVGLPWEPETCAACGSIDCLSYAHASGCPWDSNTCRRAAGRGNLDCLAYAHGHGCAWDTKVPLDAAGSGHLDCLKYAHTHGCPYPTSEPGKCYWFGERPERLTIQAIWASSMPCLMYVREAMGCTWDPSGYECELAFERGEFELLQYIHTHGGVFEHLRWYNRTEWLNACGAEAERNAMCLSYVHLCGAWQYLAH